MVAMKAVSALDHANRDPAHLAREVEVRVRTFDAAHTGASTKASCRLGNPTACSNLPSKHSALVLGNLRLRSFGLLLILDFRRAIGTDSARTCGGGGDTRRSRRCRRLRLRRARHLGRRTLERRSSRSLDLGSFGLGAHGEYWDEARSARMDKLLHSK